MANIRLYIEEEFKVGGNILITDSVGHYLANVMRVKLGIKITLFNGRDGEWMAEVIKAGKGKALVTVRQQLKPQPSAPDLWYLFAPLKKGRVDYMMQKATELGVNLIRPVQTERTHNERIKWHKMEMNAIEAAEQSGRLEVPEFRDIIKLPELLKGWPDDRKLIFCDEAGEAQTMIEAAEKYKNMNCKWAVLIGPEGGFSPAERDQIRAHPAAVPVTLGPRILRADTAAVAVLSLWQSLFGDWG
jgi:16S rRNA (uracil1498-N3)-methyltransferase